METGKTLRIRRLFSKGRTVIVPIDHALYSGPIGSIADIKKLVEMISKTSADGILITPGILTKVHEKIGNLGVVMRIDGTQTRLGSHLEKCELFTTIEHAIILGTDAVAINIFVGQENEHEMLKKLGYVATVCYKWGLPLMAEMISPLLLTYHYEKNKQDYDMKKAADEIKLISRLGAELGADIIKTYYTGNMETFKEIVLSTQIPIVIAGGPKMVEDKKFLLSIDEAIRAGAKGICIGRYVWQRNNIYEMISALCHIIHDNVKIEEVVNTP